MGGPVGLSPAGVDARAVSRTYHAKAGKPRLKPVQRAESGKHAPHDEQSYPAPRNETIHSHPPHTPSLVDRGLVLQPLLTSSYASSGHFLPAIIGDLRVLAFSPNRTAGFLPLTSKPPACFGSAAVNSSACLASAPPCCIRSCGYRSKPVRSAATKHRSRAAGRGWCLSRGRAPRRVADRRCFRETTP